MLDDTLCPFCGDRKATIGRLVHILFEHFSILHLESLKCTGEFETPLKRLRFEVKKTVPDLMIERELNFINNIEVSRKIISFPSEVKRIIIDFTISSKLSIVYSKLLKYHNKICKIVNLFTLIEDNTPRKY